MSSFDLSRLPPSLAAYFSADDQQTKLELFAPDARVQDEGGLHEGRAAIAAWLESIERRYHPRYAVMDATDAAMGLTVTFEVSGTFPASPAVLKQAFVLDSAGRIASLRTL